MPTCVCCNVFSPLLTDFHQFTNKAHLRELWLDALTKDDTAKAALDMHLRTARGKHHVLTSHFSSESYVETPTSRILKSDAVPVSKRGSPRDYRTPTYRTPTSPSPTPDFPLLQSTPTGRPSFSRPLPSFRLASAPIPPCCRCCCKKETESDMKKDSNYTPPEATISQLPSSDYFIVSRESLVELLSRCNNCPSGRNSLTFTQDAHAVSCKCVCTTCGKEYTWSNSPVLQTASASPKEKLKQINVDMVVGSAVTAVGTSRLNYFLKTVGLNTVSTTSFHRLKNDYLLPALTSVYNHAQEEVFARLRDRLAKGQKLHVAGDGSFDSRGYSAEWCRYFLVDAETGEALVYVLMNKKETGSSGKLEVACLEKGLKILAEKIGGEQHIKTLVTDRHAAVIKMMKDRFPSILHYFDPWHFFRNITLSLLKITKPAYMGLVKFYTRRIINKAYGAVMAAQGDGVLAREMFLASLHCISGKHDFTNDSSFTKFKQCTHSPCPPNYPFVQIGSRAFKKLASTIFTEKNLNDIMNVSWMLKTSTCESLNALAWRYAPKDFYFDRNGHIMRTMMCMLHWNELKKDEMDGTRIVVGKKGYQNPTLKKTVFRNVKTAAKNQWRDAVKAKAYQCVRLRIALPSIRASLASTPYATMKEEETELQKKKDQWNSINTPTVPHSGDSNLDESDDEDALPVETPFSLERLDAVMEEIRALLEEDDQFNTNEAEEEEEEEL